MIVIINANLKKLEKLNSLYTVQMEKFISMLPAISD